MRRIPSSHMQQLCGNEEAGGKELKFTSRQQRAYLCCTLAVGCPAEVERKINRERRGEKEGQKKPTRDRTPIKRRKKAEGKGTEGDPGALAREGDLTGPGTSSQSSKEDKEENPQRVKHHQALRYQ